MIRILAAILVLLAGPSSAQIMTGLDHSVSSSSFTGPGNVVSGAVAFWGLRAYSQSYANSHGKLANVCTPSDASCQDVPSDSSGNFNLGATSLTCNNSGSICTIKTFYDQSGSLACGGSACDATQATIANRPTLVVPGAANGCTTTSKYCANTVNAVNLTTPSLTQTQPLTMSAVYEIPSRTQDMILLDNSGGLGPKLWGGLGGANAIGIAISGGSNLIATATDGVYHAVQAVAHNTTSNIYVDGSSNSGTIGATAGFSSTLTMFDTAGFGLIGFFNEMGIWPSDLCSPSCTNAAAINTNQHNYWGF